jgi:hypothetical protein
MKKIKSASRVLSLLFQALCFIFPIGVLYMMFFHLEMMMRFIDASSLASPYISYKLSHFTYSHQAVILAIQAIPVSITVYIFHQLAKLFGLYEKGFLFEEENIRLIRSISLFMMIGELIQLIYQPMMTVALTFNNAPGERLASITIGTSNLSTFITGMIIFIASWIIKEAQQLKSDAELTI